MGLVPAVANVLALVGCLLPPSRSDAGRAWRARQDSVAQTRSATSAA